MQDIWTTLYKIRNNIIIIKLLLRIAYNTKKLLYRLYDSLSTKYIIIITILKSNKEKNEIKALRILQEMKNSLSNIEIDLYARCSQNTR